MKNFALPAIFVGAIVFYAPAPASADWSRAGSREFKVSYQDQDPDENQDDDSGNYDVFYDQLNQDGSWYNDDTYGYVFQPSVAASSENWRPYADGHWVWTDRGWCWVSNEHFGWACYHYGRWIRVRGVGWVWVPGREWAPAWVSWRDSDEYVGWAPLPPEATFQANVGFSSWCDHYYDIGPQSYCFVNYHNWFRPNYQSYLAPYSQNVTIINQTRNITNITYSNSVIQNNGPRVETIQERTNQQVPRYNVNYVAQKGAGAAFRTVTQGNQLQVVAPGARLQPRASIQPAVKRQLAGAPVERGWQNVDAAQAQKLRQQIAAQGKVPAGLPPQPKAPPKPEIVTRPNQPPGGKPGTANQQAEKVLPAHPNEPPPGEKNVPSNNPAAEERRKERAAQGKAAQEKAAQEKAAQEKAHPTPATVEKGQEQKKQPGAEPKAETRPEEPAHHAPKAEPAQTARPEHQEHTERTSHPEATPHQEHTSHPEAAPHQEHVSHPEPAHQEHASRPQPAPHQEHVSQPQPAPHQEHASHPQPAPHQEHVSQPQPAPHQEHASHPQPAPHQEHASQPANASKPAPQKKEGEKKKE